MYTISTASTVVVKKLREIKRNCGDKKLWTEGESLKQKQNKRREQNRMTITMRVMLTERKR